MDHGTCFCAGKYIYIMFHERSIGSRAGLGNHGGRPLPLPGYQGKPCTVWIGRIAPSVTEETIKEISEQCGTIRSIRSYIDSTKGFSLVTFSGPEGVYLA